MLVGKFSVINLHLLEAEAGCEAVVLRLVGSTRSDASNPAKVYPVSPRASANACIPVLASVVEVMMALTCGDALAKNSANNSSFFVK